MFKERMLGSEAQDVHLSDVDRCSFRGGTSGEASDGTALHMAYRFSVRPDRSLRRSGTTSSLLLLTLPAAKPGSIPVAFAATCRLDC